MICLCPWGRAIVDGKKVAQPVGLWQFLIDHAPEIGAYCDAVQIPPPSLTQSGRNATGDGYGITWRRQYDGTFWGDTEKLRRAVATLRAHGVRVVARLVLHQFAELTRRYPNNAKGAQTEAWFQGTPVPPWGKANDTPGGPKDPAFGLKVNYQYNDDTVADAIDWIGQMSRTLGIYDFNIDDAKGTHTDSLQRIMAAHPNCTFLAEFYSGSPQGLGAWVASVNGRAAVEDFTGKFRNAAACNEFNAWLLDLGYAAEDPDHSAEFLENADTDLNAPTISNKLLGYAWQCGLPAHRADVYGPDYFTQGGAWVRAYGLREAGLQTILWFHRMFSIGAFQERFRDGDVAAYTRDGNGGRHGWSGGALVVVNFNTQHGRWLDLQTMWPEGTGVHNYAPAGGDATVGRNGVLRIFVGPNTNAEGQSFGLWAPGGVHMAVPYAPLTTMQSFEGGPGEILPTLKNGTNVMPQRLFCAKGFLIQAQLSIRREGVDGSAVVRAEIVGPDGATVARGSTGKDTLALAQCLAAPETGWYTLRFEGSVLPEAGVAFECPVQYMGAA